MNKMLIDYLEKIDKYLKPLPAADRADIVKEIQSSILELQANDSLSPEQIIERLGEPKELAKAYLGESIWESKGIGLKRFFTLAAFYSLVSLSGMIILPVTSISAAAFLFSGILAPICGSIKLAAALLGYDVPFIMFQFGSCIAPPLLTFFLSIITGIILLAIGRGFWKITVAYIKSVSKRSEKLDAAL